jgi:hypothetical protein
MNYVDFSVSEGFTLPVKVVKIYTWRKFFNNNNVSFNKKQHICRRKSNIS